MEITINVPDEAIDRIAEGLKRDIRSQVKQKNAKVEFKKDGIELIASMLQDKIDDLFIRTDPDYIAKKKAIREQTEKADQEVKAKLEALKK